jgi:ParB/RepB/Spo0J family partition protein
MPTTEIPITAIQPDPQQPRKAFDSQAISSLAASIKRNGLINPITVRRTDKGFVIVAGERRWLAAKKAGVQAIECRVLNTSAEDAKGQILAENLHRRDLNGVEEAEGIVEFQRVHGLTVEQTAEALDLLPAQVSACQRIVDLPDSVKIAAALARMPRSQMTALFRDKEPAEMLQKIHDLKNQIITGTGGGRRRSSNADDRKDDVPAAAAKLVRMLSKDHHLEGKLEREKAGYVLKIYLPNPAALQNLLGALTKRSEMLNGWGPVQPSRSKQIQPNPTKSK